MALHDLGFLKNPKKIDAEKLMEHVKAVGGWYMEDSRRPDQPELRDEGDHGDQSDPRSEFYDLMRRENVPANELMGRRMETGVLAVLGQLDATRNWYRIGASGGSRTSPRPSSARGVGYFEARGQPRRAEVAAPGSGGAGAS